MSNTKTRLTVTVDPALVRAGNRAVAEGRAGSLSAWVNEALAERAAKERRLAALAEAVASYEVAFGPISDQELLLQRRLDRAAAKVIRAGGRTPSTGRRRKAGAA
jgi:hypothetical protein